MLDEITANLGDLDLLKMFKSFELQISIDAADACTDARARKNYKKIRVRPVVAITVDSKQFEFNGLSAEKELPGYYV